MSPVSGRIKVNYFAHTRLTLEAKFREVNNVNGRRRCEICSKLTMKTPCLFLIGMFIVNFEHISHLVLVFILLILRW